ncbi:hypothetical protein [Arthrobacter sp. NEB 688]|uniref:hypothetical protein n=1 Tax=Arthrobacter sp. NEB 688 TaxID=904039 RepID=UPI0015674A09|nr:hypothetical protein [Arthrobacter sp. NEB 688]QKE85374.1 hypothetical protein HL663_16480 [Arthrobacter sp. NEB 688]
MAHPAFTYVEEHARRPLTVLVAVLALCVLAAGALLRSRDGGLDLSPDGPLDWAVAVLALAAVPAWLVLGDGAWGDWPQASGLAVAADRLVVDEVTFGFEELDEGTAHLPAPPTGRRGTVEVPLAAGGSLTLRPHDAGAFSRSLVRAYRAWAAGPPAP